MKRSEIEQLLPEVFQRTSLPGTPLFALLEVMETLHAPSEAILAELDGYFDPYRAPDRFVPLLAQWVDMGHLLVEPVGGVGTPSFPSGTGRLRALVAAAAFLSKWRGTARGLLHYLETATGCRGFQIEERVMGEDGSPRPFHLRVVVPEEAGHYRTLIEQIVEMEKPAYMTHEIHYGLREEH